MLVNPDKRYLYFGLSILLLNTTALVAAEEDIARCARIASVGDRILCLEDALREKSAKAPTAPVTKGPDSSAAEVTQAHYSTAASHRLTPHIGQ